MASFIYNSFNSLYVSSIDMASYSNFRHSENGAFNPVQSCKSGKVIQLFQTVPTPVSPIADSNQQRHIPTPLSEPNIPKKEMKYSDSKWWECTEEKCMATFTTKQHLTDHIRYVHLNLRRFTCEECGFKFATKTHLKRHIDRSNGQLFPCTLCAHSFQTSRQLSHHYRYVHRTFTAHATSGE